MNHNNSIMRQLIKSLLILFLLNTTVSVFGQTKVDMEFIPVLIEGKWGYIDLHGNIVIDPRFDSAGVFYDGLAKVGLTLDNDNQEVYGFIDHNGTYVIEPKYIDATYFSEGIAFVVNPDLYIEAIDTKGEILYQLGESIEQVSVFRGGWAKVQVAGVLNEDTYRFINKSGETELSLSHVIVNDFSEGLCAVLVMDDRLDSWLWGYIDTSGEMLIPARFDFADDFKDGQAVVKGMDGGYGVIDRAGNYIIEPIYDYIMPDEDEFIFVQEDRFGRINREGNITLKPKYGAISVFKEDMAVAYPLEGELCGYIDRSGNYLIEPNFVMATPPKDDMMIVVTNDGSWRLMNKEGNYINTPGYTIEYVASDYISHSIYSGDLYSKGSYVMSASSYSPIEESVDFVEEAVAYMPEGSVAMVSDEEYKVDKDVFKGNEIIIPGTKYILIVSGPSEPDFPCIGVGFYYPFSGGSNTYIEVKRREGYFKHREEGAMFNSAEKALEDGLKELFLHRFGDEEIWNRFVEYGGLKIFVEQAMKYIDDEFLDSGWNDIYG